MLFGGQLVQLYNGVEFRGVRRDIGLGIHEAWGTVEIREFSYDINIPISSMRYQLTFVTFVRNIKKMKI